MYTILTIIRYPKWMGWAGFVSMALFRLPLWLNRSVSFWKLLGCGKNGSFDSSPDWRQWGMLTVLPKQISTDWVLLPSSNGNDILGNLSPFIAKFISLCKGEVWTLILEPIEGHGKWDGKECFGELPKQTAYDGVIGILTRATIRLQKLRAFWKNVDGVASQMNSAPGFITSVGIGEVPWIKQATFSIWESKEQMKQFASKMQEHAEVIRKTRKENWYSEDMFVRFKILASYGSLQGHDPLKKRST